jgi:glycosyltransferase involved in cell wall biosynthesis
MRVCVVIPCFNEAKVIGDVVKDAKKVFRRSRLTFEIVVIDDRSSDDSGNVASNAGATVIYHILNQGAGGATSTGLRYAEEYGFDMAVTMDADGQHDPDDVLACVNKAITDNSDLLVGSRLINTKGMSKSKIIGNKGLSLITRLLFGINVTDSQSGLRVLSKKALKNLRWKSTGYDFASEMLWRAKQVKLKITEAPVRAIYTEDSISKGQNNWNAINIVKSLLRQRFAELFE